MPIDVVVPSVGESISEVFIGTWLKRPGDSVNKDEPLAEIETDKVTLEVPASVAGVLSEVLKETGDSAMVGEVIARITEGAAGDGTPGGAEAGPADGPAAVGQRAEGAAGVTVMPAARRVLDEHGLSADAVQPTGPGGRVLKEDVLRAIAEGDRDPGLVGDAAGLETLDRQGPGAPSDARPGAGVAEATLIGRQEEVVRMTPLRLLTAQRLVEAQRDAALLTTFNEIDMSDVIDLRKRYREAFETRHGIRLGFMSFFVKATIEALKQVPRLNAEIRDDAIVYKGYYDIGVAVSTRKGLIVPVIRDAERLSFAEIERRIADFGARAASNRLTPAELTGGTFTISNGGVFGSLMSTPIVNPPQSGVLGMHAIQDRPVAIDGAVVIRPMMYIALTYDHRLVDGREAVTFLRAVKDAVERPARMLLEI